MSGSSGYRHKRTGPYADFIVRARGTGDHPELTVEVDTSWNQDFVNELKSALRHASERTWDPDLKRWFISPNVLEAACQIAGRFFPHVYLTEGDKITDVVTGVSYEQNALFSD